MQRKIHLNNVSIFYQVKGEGLPVVLLHGLPLDSTVWNEQINFLKTHCKLIVPDIPGSGKSIFEKHETKATTIEYYAVCIQAILQHENVDACIMLGHSMGGYITLAFAEKYSKFLKGYGLIHSTAFPDSEEKKQMRQRAIATIDEYGAYAFLKSTTPNLFGDEFRKEHPEKIEAIIERGKNFSTKSLQDYYKAMMQRPDRTDVLKKSRVPVLFIIGTEDTAAPMKDVLQQVHLPEIAYIHILENTGHISMLESGEQLNSAILEFIKDISGNE
jgi:pimeloyl-ACP methyl ester carboxylesterase